MHLFYINYLTSFFLRIFLHHHVIVYLSHLGLAYKNLRGSVGAAIPAEGLNIRG